jgi:hypothetical protein
VTTTDLAHGIREAHDLIAKRGYCAGQFYEEETGALDIGGAFYFAFPYRADRDSARLFVRTAVRELYPDTPGPRNFDLYNWADGVDPADVLAALLHAAVLAERIPA